MGTHGPLSWPNSILSDLRGWARGQGALLAAEERYVPLEQAAGALLLACRLWAQHCSDCFVEDGLQASLGECRTFQVLH